MTRTAIRRKIRNQKQPLRPCRTTTTCGGCGGVVWPIRFPSACASGLLLRACPSLAGWRATHPGRPVLRVKWLQQHRLPTCRCRMRRSSSRADQAPNPDYLDRLQCGPFRAKPVTHGQKSAFKIAPRPACLLDPCVARLRRVWAAGSVEARPASSILVTRFAAFIESDSNRRPRGNRT